MLNWVKRFSDWLNKTTISDAVFDSSGNKHNPEDRKINLKGIRVSDLIEPRKIRESSGNLMVAFPKDWNLIKNNEFLDIHLVALEKTQETVIILSKVNSLWRNEQKES